MDFTNQINLALKDFSEGNKERAYKKLKKISNKDQKNDQLRFNLAVIEQTLNLNEEAKKNYRYLINKNNNIKAMINLYLLNIKEEDYHGAINIIDKIISENLGNDSTIKDKASVLYKLKRYEESINICKNYLKFDTDIIFKYSGPKLLS